MIIPNQVSLKGLEYNPYCHHEFNLCQKCIAVDIKIFIADLLNKKIEEIEKEIQNSDYNTNECYVPEEWEQKREIANLPLWVREYFRIKGLDEAKQIIEKQ